MDLIQEQKLCKLIERLETNYGMYIGSKSLSALFHFLGGYAWCVYEREHYLLQFHPCFQRYMEETYRNQSPGASWLELLLSHRQEAPAFERFFADFRSFLAGSEYGSCLAADPQGSTITY